MLFRSGDALDEALYCSTRWDPPMLLLSDKKLLESLSAALPEVGITLIPVAVQNTQEMNIGNMTDFLTKEETKRILQSLRRAHAAKLAEYQARQALEKEEETVYDSLKNKVLALDADQRVDLLQELAESCRLRVRN